jgi:hypothetical protein
VLPLQAIKSVLVRVTEPDWKWDIPLGYKALTPNENDEAFRRDVHLGKMDVKHKASIRMEGGAVISRDLTEPVARWTFR